MVLARIQAIAFHVRVAESLQAIGSVPPLLSWAPGRLRYLEEGKERRRGGWREEGRREEGGELGC